MNNTNFTSEKLKGRGFSSAPWINNYNKSINTKEEQNGRSMIEMLGVLAIIGVLSVGGIADYSKAMFRYKINKTIEQITLIAGNVRAFFGPQKSYDGVHCGCSARSCWGETPGDGCPILKKAKIIPDEMLTVDSSGKITAITNPFGSAVSLMRIDKSSEGDKKGFIIDYPIYENPEACIELLTQDWSNANVSYIGVISLDAYFTIPAKIDDATEACSDVDATDLYFFFDTDINYHRDDANIWYE